MLPIYDEIVSQMTGSEPSLSRAECTTIAKLSQEHLDIIYLLILHHYMQENPGKKDIPYNGKTISDNKEVMYRKLSQLPDDIQKIINKYLSLIT